MEDYRLIPLHGKHGDGIAQRAAASGVLRPEPEHVKSSYYGLFTFEVPARRHATIPGGTP